MLRKYTNRTLRPHSTSAYSGGFGRSLKLLSSFDIYFLFLHVVLHLQLIYSSCGEHVVDYPEVIVSVGTSESRS